MSERRVQQIERKINNAIDYERHKEERKRKRKERYYLEKAKLAKEQAGKYTAKDIKVLMSLKTYTELSKEKQQTWLDFQWVFKDIQRYGVYTIGEIQELVAKGENLIKDYLATAKAETISRAKRWNSLSEKEQKEFIAYLSRKRVAEREGKGGGGRVECRSERVRSGDSPRVRNR